ncbi:hypothetical protein QR680_012128 [Steinernema hermaphroditum]|uniref:RYYR-CCHC domain-containing protein n=1 Tax=Steinernema hermaphroditum TaxID=289476 RepID=A0AA39M002_9BILA|nr:hypothetical protein QR680_012128 [Steinernema hermaphroditum]
MVPAPTPSAKVRRTRIDYDSPEVQAIVESVPESMTYREASERISALIGRRIDSGNLYRYCKRRKIQTRSQLSNRFQEIPPDEERGTISTDQENRAPSVEIIDDEEPQTSQSSSAEPSPAWVKAILEGQKRLEQSVQRLEQKFTADVQRLEAAINSLVPVAVHGTDPQGQRVFYEIHEDPNSVSFNGYDPHFPSTSQTLPNPAPGEPFELVLSRGKLPALRVTDPSGNVVRLYRQGGKGRPGSNTLYYRCSRCDNLYGKRDSTAKVKFVNGRPASTLFPTHHEQCKGLTPCAAEELQARREEKAIKKARRAESNRISQSNHTDNDENNNDNTAEWSS